MSHMLDRAARILAKPASRRDSLRLIGGMFSGSVLGALWVGRLNAQGVKVQGNAGRCGSQTCHQDQKCCTTGSRPFCLTYGKTCCGNEGCRNSDQKCCTTGSAPFCATRGKTCCGNSACGTDDKCCATSSRPFCASRGRTCCGDTSCASVSQCCDHKVCCDEHQKCLEGRCSASNT